MIMYILESDNELMIMKKKTTEEFKKQMQEFLETFI